MSAALPEVRPYPLDVLDAESEGMLGYLIEQELSNELADRDGFFVVYPQGIDKSWNDGRPETEFNFELYRQATNKIVGLTDEAAKINLNTAPRSMLEALPGITPELVEAIISWRSRNQAGGGDSTARASRAGTSMRIAEPPSDEGRGGHSTASARADAAGRGR